MTAAAGLGWIQLWKGQVRNQFEADACIAKAAQQSRSVLKQTENSIQRMKWAKHAFRLALTPETKAALLIEIQFEVGVQDFQKLRWNRIRIGALDCRKLSDSWQLGSEFPWVRAPADDAGPGLLTWMAKPDARFRFQMNRSNRYSAAVVYQNESNWRLQWTKPDKPFSNLSFGFF
ncbi:MAG: hypothetical protein JNL01_05380 [Bdellovibrionales bacterium]|nr:hypothetical protein [Bdellovibrionales bacterium]